MTDIKVGDKVRVIGDHHTGKSGKVVWANTDFPFPYRVEFPDERYQPLFSENELKSLYMPEPLAEWEKDLLFYGVSSGGIYNEVVKAHGFDPMAGEGY